MKQLYSYSPFGAPLPGRTYNAMEDMNKVTVVEGPGGLTGWSTPNSSTSVSNDAVKVTFATTNTGVVEMNKTLSTIAGKHYRISFNANTATYTNVSVEIVGYNNTALSSATLNTGITHYQLDFTANDASTVVKVSLGTGTGTRTIYLDNVKIEEIKGSVKGYSNGFNGYTKDDEIYGEGNACDFGDRVHNTRLGRFFSIDPFNKRFASQSGYVFAGNTPLQAIDKNGKYIYFVTADPNGGAPIIVKVDATTISKIPGATQLLKTEMGKALVNAYLNSSKKDVFISMKDITEVGTNGLTLDPKSNPINSQGKFDVGLTRGKKGAITVQREFSQFDGVQVRENAESTTFVVLDNEPRSDTKQAETLGHELIHVGYFYMAIPAAEHHDKMGETEGPDSKKDLPKLKNELQKVDDEKKSE